MGIRKRNQYFLGLVSAVLFAFQASPSVAQSANPDEGLPVLRAGAMPLYPVIASAARVQGTVKLKVSTDGKIVTSVEVLSGPAMLAEAAKKVADTWVFDPYRPITFISIFDYQIIAPARCEYSNSSVTANLPSELHITTNGIETCDPASTVSKKERKGSPSAH